MQIPQDLIETATLKLKSVKSEAEFFQLRSQFLGKKSFILSAFKKLKSIEPNLKASMAKDLNILKSNLTKVFEDAFEGLNLSNQSGQIDIFLPPYEKPLFVYEQFKNYPRYLCAVKIRIEKYNHRQIKDQELFRDINRLQIKWIEKVTSFSDLDQEVPKPYVDFFWAMQELRVSLFAQELKTPYPISVKRLEKKWVELVN